MSRIRNIKPDTFIDPDLAELGFAARYFFIGLWCQGDREGRLRDEPKRLAIQIIPFDLNKVDAEVLLSELSPRFIRRYEISGVRYIQIVNFCRHQRPHINEQPSNIPKEPKESTKDGTPRESSVQGTTKVVPRTLYKGEGKGDGEGNTDSSEPLKAVATEPPILTFPVVGKVNEWHLTRSAIYPLKQAFPTSDISAECRKALAWVQANPSKRKTPRGMAAFLYRWIERGQNGWANNKQIPKDPYAGLRQAADHA